MGNTSTQDWYRSVTLNMTREQVKKYRPFHKGLDIQFYEPLDDSGKPLLKQKGYNTAKINTVDVTITAKSINPNPLHERDMRDIDDELARMDSTYRIVRDHLKHSDNKKLIHFNQPRHTLLRHSVILDHPYLDGENDHLKSNAQEVHDVKFPVDVLREEERKLEKRKAFYNRSKLHYVAKLDRTSGDKYATMKMGYIGNDY